MKTVIRTALIVLASLLVIGAAYAFVEYGGMSLLPTGPGRGERGELPEGFQQGGDFESAEGVRPEGGRPERDGFAPSGEGFRRGGHNEGGLAGLAQVFKNVVVMGVITLVVVAGGILWRVASRQFRRSTTAPPAAPPAA